MRDNSMKTFGIPQTRSSLPPSQHTILPNASSSPKFTTAAQAQALGQFGTQLTLTIRPQSLSRTLGVYTGQLFYGQGQNKKADNAWGPRDRTRHQNQTWPIVVLEVAVSETRVKLETDISFWLTRAFGQVKMVVALQVVRIGDQIRLDKWVLDDNAQPDCAQQITLTKTSATGNNGPLVIEFAALFLRPPQPEECDLIIDDTGLDIIAQNVWISTRDM